VIPLSNSEKFVDFSISMCQNLSRIWGSSNLTNKIKFQEIVFPEGISYDMPNHAYRTKRVNSVILQISHLATVSERNKKRNPSRNKKDSALVPPEGIEPPSREPESLVLSIKLRRQLIAKILNPFSIFSIYFTT
jgi:site-specific DNA recombinase